MCLIYSDSIKTTLRRMKIPMLVPYMKYYFNSPRFRLFLVKIVLLVFILILLNGLLHAFGDTGGIIPNDPPNGNPPNDGTK